MVQREPPRPCRPIKRHDSFPAEAPRMIARKPPIIIDASPVPVGNIDYAGGWIAGQAPAEAQAEKAKEPSDAPPPTTRRKPSICCNARRRISNASSVSIRSMRQVKRKVEHLCRRQKEQKVKEQERREAELQERAERAERAKDRLMLEKLEGELERERQYRRREDHFDGQYRGWGWNGY